MAGRRERLPGPSGFGLIKGRAKVFQGVCRLARPIPDQRHGKRDKHEDGHARHDGAPAHAGELEHDEINRTASRRDQGRWLSPAFPGLDQLELELLEEHDGVELEHGGVGSDEAANVDWSREHLEIAGLERPQMVRLDLRDFGDLIDVELLSLARVPKLLRDGGHSRES